MRFNTSAIRPPAKPAPRTTMSACSRIMKAPAFTDNGRRYGLREVHRPQSLCSSRVAIHAVQELLNVPQVSKYPPGTKTNPVLDGLLQGTKPRPGEESPFLQLLHCAIASSCRDDDAALHAHGKGEVNGMLRPKEAFTFIQVRRPEKNERPNFDRMLSKQLHRLLEIV